MTRSINLTTLRPRLAHRADKAETDFIRGLNRELKNQTSIAAIAAAIEVFIAHNLY